METWRYVCDANQVHEFLRRGHPAKQVLALQQSLGMDVGLPKIETG